jgi:MFS family permease
LAAEPIWLAGTAAPGRKPPFSPLRGFRALKPLFRIGIRAIPYPCLPDNPAAMPNPVSSARRLVLLVCAAQVLVQIGAYTWPALLPQFVEAWQLSNSEAGIVTGAFYAAYVLAVPVLVTLTDRIDPKRIYLLGVALTVASHLAFAALASGFWSALGLRMLAGIGWAGTYMTGLKLLADRVDAQLMSRAVAGHAASIGIAGALSFVFAAGLAGIWGWQGAFVAAGLSAAVGWALVALGAPRAAAPLHAGADRGALFDFRPVLRNRSAMAYAVAYGVHTFEMSALRGWVVAFLGYVAASTATSSAEWLAPAAVATTMALLGTWASVLGNEWSIRWGRKRLIAVAMLGAGALALAVGFVGPGGYGAATLLVLAWAVFIWLDSSSLTAGAAGSAEPARRGATLALHSMFGYLGGFVGPFAVGWMLDLAGGMSRLGWALAFGLVALVVAAGFVAHRWLGPRPLPGDRR